MLTSFNDSYFMSIDKRNDLFAIISHLDFYATCLVILCAATLVFPFPSPFRGTPHRGPSVQENKLSSYGECDNDGLK